jgi:hypothetical protein|tara:strand:+ start:1362 stop:1559 length:198 start_codon:yes stop_codon:yes gene_type:complete
MKIGDLVTHHKDTSRMGCVIDIFADLDEEDPWIRIRWTMPVETWEWSKRSGLVIISENQKQEKKE